MDRKPSSFLSLLNAIQEQIQLIESGKQVIDEQFYRIAATLDVLDRSLAELEPENSLDQKQWQQWKILLYQVHQFLDPLIQEAKQNHPRILPTGDELIHDSRQDISSTIAKDFVQPPEPMLGAETSDSNDDNPLDLHDFETVDEIDASIEKGRPKILEHEELMTPDGIRRRLGLPELHEQYQERDQSTSNQREEQEQESLQDDMTRLAKQLKMGTQNISKTLQADAQLLDQVGERTESNLNQVDTASARLKQYAQDSIGFFQSVMLILAVLVVFMSMYFFIKLFPKSR